ncbi:hypothetical protein K3X44_07850 [Aliiroseovarius crassostreae]|uniref:Uncharacterized protein n=1 Tax=Aliiroseovarius crassostreae TaxID=154981 RepID=A0A0P7J371_9RHOB|nr:hypothetical protein [Aliiroseovarius crassostreae]KPN62122.1 hypothetical protein AKJ29_07550 [Aliiroseovarius crassostreae]UWP94187.1 hypothetical protein K3X48_07905 [Aliiroseovarius crassostreae]UWQ00466.1 hypothetical protein K3X44_07850 [Aliiroseovarius crassostreae]
MSNKRALVALVVAGLLTGCADYLNNRDTVSAATGNAMDANTAIHVVSPWPPYVGDTNLTDDN